MVGPIGSESVGHANARTGSCARSHSGPGGKTSHNSSFFPFREIAGLKIVAAAFSCFFAAKSGPLVGEVRPVLALQVGRARRREETSGGLSH